MGWLKRSFSLGRQQASILGETNDGAHTIKTFLVPFTSSDLDFFLRIHILFLYVIDAFFQGLAHFSPTGPTKFLDSAASQTRYVLCSINVEFDRDPLSVKDWGA